LFIDVARHVVTYMRRCVAFDVGLTGRVILSLYMT